MGRHLTTRFATYYRRLQLRSMALIVAVVLVMIPENTANRWLVWRYEDGSMDGGYSRPQSNGGREYLMPNRQTRPSLVDEPETRL